MDNQSSQTENLDFDLKHNDKQYDYEYLLNRLKDIKKSITLLENNFLPE